MVCVRVCVMLVVCGDGVWCWWWWCVCVVWCGVCVCGVCVVVVVVVFSVSGKLSVCLQRVLKFPYVFASNRLSKIFMNYVYSSKFELSCVPDIL